MASNVDTLLVGLTGGIASGKSTVGRILRSLGAEVIDADEVARAVVEPGLPAYEQLVAVFGREILQPVDPSHPQAPPPIHRERLAARVFTDESARRQLNSITHPAIAIESARRVAAFAASGGDIAVYEATLLVENGSYEGLAGLIVVDVPEELQLDRAVARGLREEQAAARMRAQVGRSTRNRFANWLIDNSGSEEETRQQIAAVWSDLRARRIPPRQG
jgi:dephospho-CoA kinase